MTLKFIYVNAIGLFVEKTRQKCRLQQHEMLRKNYFQNFGCYLSSKGGVNDLDVPNLPCLKFRKKIISKSFYRIFNDQSSVFVYHEASFPSLSRLQATPTF